jgi:hypothetical protein
MIKLYQHTQMGYWILVALGSGVFCIAALMLIHEFDWRPFSVLVVIAICLGLFCTLTVEMDEESLQVRFGPGVIRKSFRLKEIESCQVVTNPWYYGWGIRLTPYGWLYNVSGIHAVEIRMKNGKKYRIGTDEPAELATAIQQALGR